MLQNLHYQPPNPSLPSYQWHFKVQVLFLIDFSGDLPSSESTTATVAQKRKTRMTSSTGNAMAAIFTIFSLHFPWLIPRTLKRPFWTNAKMSKIENNPVLISSSMTLKCKTLLSLRGYNIWSSLVWVSGFILLEQRKALAVQSNHSAIHNFSA